MTIIIAAEALLYSARPVVELAYMDLSLPYYSGIDNSVSYFGVFEFYYNRGGALEWGFLGQPSHE